MTTRITIRQRPDKSMTDSPNADIDFGGGVYPITIQSPFDKKQEAELEWYFERHLEFPFTDKVRAKDAAASIATYGESLFAQLTGDPAALTAYRNATQRGLATVEWEIVGDTTFHRLHWEALREPGRDPFVLHAPMVRRRRQAVPPIAAPKASPTLNVLVVSARPGGIEDVSYRTISRPLVEALDGTELPVVVDIVRPGTYRALVEHLDAKRRANENEGGYYHILHLDLHGAVLTGEEVETLPADRNEPRIVFRKALDDRFARPNLDAPTKQKAQAWIFFEREDDRPQNPTSADELGELVKNHGIPMVVLNACQSAKEEGENDSSETSIGARLMLAGVQSVIAMGYSITVTAATHLMKKLYSDLFQHRSLNAALCDARALLNRDKLRNAYFKQQIALEDWLLPVVYQATDTAPTLPLRDPSTAERLAFRRTQKERYKAPKTEYGFVGRDTDLLTVEKKVLLPREGGKHNILLIQGMGGAGKSTFLHHTAEWWRRTGLVQNVFYYGYDERAYTRDHIVEAIAIVLFNDGLRPEERVLPNYADYSSMMADERADIVAEKLGRERHLLILDNLESVTAQQMAIQNTLNLDEQKKLAGFLAALVGGETLVLLGSRSQEEWLAKTGVLKESDRYPLPGLDKQSASTLVEYILERHVPDKQKQDAYRQQTGFKTLLEVLNGYPLPLQVVFSNLRHQSPDEIVETFREGGMLDEKIDPNDPQARTKSILRSIEYAFSNLDPAAQTLLLCLAPFTGVLNRDWLPQYTKQLQSHAELADLPYNRWNEILQTAAEWGLLQSHEVPSHFRLQPTFPYFLRNRLTTPENEVVEQAIERAFAEHYSQLGYAFQQTIQSRESAKQRVGYFLTQLHYENLYQGIQLGVSKGVDIEGIYSALYLFLERNKQSQLALSLTNDLIKRLETYLATNESASYERVLIMVYGQQANGYLNLQNYLEAEKSYYKLLEKLKDASSLAAKQRGKWEATAYHQLGLAAQEQRKYEEAEAHYRQAIALYQEFNDRYSQAKTYHQLGIVAQDQRKYGEAEAHYRQALALYQEFNDRYEQAGTYHQLGNVAQEQRNYGEAEAHYRQALALLQEFNDRYEQAKTYHNLGSVAQEQRKYGEAEVHYRQALALFQEFNDRYEQATTYHNLGIVAQEQRKYGEAEAHYRQALALFQEFNDRYSQATTYHQLGIVAQAQRKYGEAEAHYRQALTLKQEFNDRYSQATTYHQLGRVAQEQRKYGEAEAHYRQALALKQEFNDRYSQAKTYHQLGSVAQDQRKYEEAEAHYRQALVLKQEFNDPYSQATTYGQWGLLAQAQEQWVSALVNALTALSLFSEFNDSHGASISAQVIAQVWKEHASDELLKEVAEQVGMETTDLKTTLEQIVTALDNSEADSGAEIGIDKDEAGE